MRVNVYAEEMTDRIEIIAKVIDGRPFTGLRFYLELPATVNGQQYRGPFMHRPGDDDSSAVTFWGKRDLRVVLRKALTELDRHYAESASPPRAPGASAQPLPEGVQSGPGQPIDICERLDADAKINSGLNAYRGWPDETAALEREAAAEIRRLREQVKTERRDGIEAAATHLAATTATRHLADEVRALADAPAPDPLLAGLAHVREHLRTDGHAVRLIAWLDAEIAKRGETEVQS